MGTDMQSWVRYISTCEKGREMYIGFTQNYSWKEK